MSDHYDPGKHGGVIDRLRHSDPKIARRLKRAGSRAAQFAVMQQIEKEKERKMATRIRGVGTAKQLNISMSEELYNRFMAVQGGETRVSTIEKLLAKIESSGAMSEDEKKTLAIVKDEQALLRLPDLASTVRRLAEKAGRADARAKQVIEMEKQQEDLLRTIDGKQKEIEALRKASTGSASVDQEITTLLDGLMKRGGYSSRIEALQETLRYNSNVGKVVSENDSLKSDLAAERDRITALKATVEGQHRKIEELKRSQPSEPVAQSAVEEALFDWINAFKGTTAVADPSGKVVVSASPKGLSEMFGIWARSVSLLGINQE